MKRRILRVFPRRTRATPIDEGVRVGQPPGMLDAADEVHVSVAFSWDIPMAEWLCAQWESVAPVQIGGPAVGTAGGDFVAGKYLRAGYTITSRGCPNRCWFCSVWKREPRVLELPIVPGWNVLDDNLLACSEGHIRSVFDMLKKQPQRVQLTGGIDAQLLQDWHVNLLADLRLEQAFLAYDTADDWDPLVAASRLLSRAFNMRSRHAWRCYVLIGGPGDSLSAAEARLRATWDLGFLPMAMLWRPPGRHCDRDAEWMRLQRSWARPALIRRIQASLDVTERTSSENPEGFRLEHPA